MKTKKNIELLISILEKSKIKSLEISSFWGFKKIKLSKEISSSSLSRNFSSEESSPSEIEKTGLVEPSPENPTSETILGNDKLETIKAPLVGTVYLSPKQGEPPFVSKDNIVKKGQVVCIIEAMKIFNEIESDKDGVLRKILVTDEDPVEFGQAIFEIESE